MDNHHEVCTVIKMLDNKQLILLGSALGLRYPSLKKMQDLQMDMVAAWLRREDNVTRVPTWRALAEALDSIGQSGCAKDIRDTKGTIP